MKRLVIFTFVVSALMLQAATINSQFVSKKAVWVAHIDIDSVKDPQSKLGSWMMEQSFKDAASRKLAALEVILGMDLRKDISGITAYGLSQGDKKSAAILTGNFDIERLTTLLAGADNYTLEIVAGYAIHSWDSKKKQGKRAYASLCDSGKIAFASDSETLVHALMVLDGKESNAVGIELMKIAAGKTMIVAAFDSPIPLEWPKAGALKMAQAGAFSIAENDDQVAIEFVLETTEKEKAENICRVAEGMKAMAMLGADKNPQAADFAKMMVVEKQENAVAISLICPTEKVIKMMQAAADRKRSARMDKMDNK